MKTWKMLKELEENKEKQFYSKCFDAIKAYVKDGDLTFIEEAEPFNDELDKLPIDCILGEWEEIDNSIDFIDAIKALDQGKKIYVIRTDGYREDFSPIGNQTDFGVAIKQSQGYPIETELILHGKWYIIN